MIIKTLKAVNVTLTACWDVKTGSVIDRYRRFGVTFCLLRQVEEYSKDRGSRLLRRVCTYVQNYMAS